MATGAQPVSEQIDPRNYRADQGFFLALSLALAGLTILGFLQLAARGITNPIAAPLHVHVHALLLVSWLGLFCYQNWLAWRGQIAAHRQWGRASLVLVAAIILGNVEVTLAAIAAGRTGAFSPAGFLALGTGDTFTFAGLVVWAVARRKDPQWHRRLFLGAALMLAAPGFNRLLGGLPGTLGLVAPSCAQLTFVAIIGWHDWRKYGRVHPATLVLVAALAVQRATPDLLPMAQPWHDFTFWITE